MPPATPTIDLGDLYRSGDLPLRAGLSRAPTPEEVGRMRRAGWQWIGVGTDRRTGVPVFLLKRATQTAEGKVDHA